MAPSAAFSAAVAGDTPLLDRILKEQSDALAMAKVDAMFKAYRDSLNGKTDENKSCGETPFNSASVWDALLTAREDSAKGTSGNHAYVTGTLSGFPTLRLLWIAEDAYQKYDPSKYDPSDDAPAFYDYLDWLFGSDPWVAKAVADFHRRGGTDNPIDPVALKADLQHGMVDPLFSTPIGSPDWTHAVPPGG
jgi:hypothetical protein